MKIQVGDETTHLDTFHTGKGADVDTGAGDSNHSQSGDPPSCRWKRLHQPTQQLRAYARAADGGDADDVIVPVAEPAAQLAAIEDRLVVQSEDVAACELVMSLGPCSHLRQPRSKCAGNDIFGPPDEDGPVTQSWKALDLLDHLCVVVGSQRNVAFAKGRHRQPTNEVRQPDMSSLFQLGVLVQVIVDLPRLIADPEVVFAFAHRVQEHHEVGKEDLVHPAPGFENMKVVGAGLKLDVLRFARQFLAQWVNPLAMRLEDSCHRVLRKPIDLQVRDQLSQLLSDSNITARVA